MIALLMLAVATAPVQPSSGPGGADYRHSKVVKTEHGQGGTQYWTFEPAEPTPASAPVIVFLHGWGAMQPRMYDRWIQHLVRRGNIVIYPRYQENLVTPPREFTPNATLAVEAAL